MAGIELSYDDIKEANEAFSTRMPLYLHEMLLDLDRAAMQIHSMMEVYNERGRPDSSSAAFWCIAARAVRRSGRLREARAYSDPRQGDWSWLDLLANAFAARATALAQPEATGGPEAALAQPDGPDASPAAEGPDGAKETAGEGQGTRGNRPDGWTPPADLNTLCRHCGTVMETRSLDCDSLRAVPYCPNCRHYEVPQHVIDDPNSGVSACMCVTCRASTSPFMATVDETRIEADLARALRSMPTVPQRNDT